MVSEWEASLTSKIYFFIILLFLIGVFWLYGSVDPENSDIFPSCPFRYATTYQCPGCGSQRAAHDLLQLNIRGAFLHMTSDAGVSAGVVIAGFGIIAPGGSG